ncbi:MAG: DUF7670 domain-containing protein [Bacteroidales bacterium]
MKSTDKILFWTPRIIGILAILFISMFALDAFDPRLSIGEQILAFLLHMIPSFVLIAVLLIAWRWEFVGGIIFAAIGLGMSPLIFMHNYLVNHFSILECVRVILLINLPFIVVGGLFIAHHYRTKKAIDE